MNEGKKNDVKDNKVRMDLLPWPELEEIGKVFTAGAKKYGPNNWQNLENGYERYKGAMLRHLTEVEKGNEVDEDTGCLHIAQVATNAIFMLHFKMEEHKRKMINSLLNNHLIREENNGRPQNNEADKR